MAEEKPIWKIKGSSEELPQDIQDALNKASETYTNEEGVTLLEAMEDITQIKKRIEVATNMLRAMKKWSDRIGSDEISEINSIINYLINNYEQNENRSK